MKTIKGTEFDKRGAYKGILMYHFTEKEAINKFSDIKGKELKDGLYFTTNREMGMLTQGKRETGRYMYLCMYRGKERGIMNLGEFDGMYKSGEKVHISEITLINEARKAQNQPQIALPEIDINNISRRALQYLKDEGIEMIYGQDSISYPYPIICVLDPSKVEIMAAVRDTMAEIPKY